MRLSPYAPRLPPHVPRLPLHVSRRALRNELRRAGTERRVLAAELGRLDETWEGISREGLRASFARLVVDAEAQAAAAAQAQAARGGARGALSGWGGAEVEVERRCAARGDTVATLSAQAATPCVWTGLQPHASRRAVEEKLLRLEQIHAAALGELARCRAAATQGWDEPEP